MASAFLNAIDKQDPSNIFIKAKSYPYLSNKGIPPSLVGAKNLLPLLPNVPPTPDKIQ